MAGELNDYPKDPFPRSDTPAPGMDQGSLIAPDYVKKEGDRIRREQAIRDAQPSFLRNPPAGPVTIAPNSRAVEWNQAGVTRTRADIFTPPETQVAGEVTASSLPYVAFLMSNATTFEGSPPVESNKVLVFDGKIKGEFPAGMGAGNYVIDLADPADSLIYAGATFDPTTLTLNSRFLGVSGSADFPESRVESATSGFLYWLLGFTYFDGDGVFTIVQTKLGNIDFEFSYGAFNGQPALLPIDTGPGWLDLVGLFP